MNFDVLEGNWRHDMSTYRHGSIVAGVLCGTLALSIASAYNTKDSTQTSAAAQQVQGGGTSAGR